MGRQLLNAARGLLIALGLAAMLWGAIILLLVELAQCAPQ